MAPQRDPEPALSDRTGGLDPALAPGSPLEAGGTFGRYQDVQLIGSGGMATVFKAQDPILGRAVALKLLAQARMEARGDVAAILGRARQALGDAIKKAPKDPEGYTAMAEADRWLAASKGAQAASSQGLLDEGVAMADKALSLDPTLAAAWAAKGALLRLGAEAARDPGHRRELALQAEAALQRAVAQSGYLRQACAVELKKTRALLEEGRAARVN